jgi:hypothetical protein
MTMLQIDQAGLAAADSGSYYFIAGTGNPLSDWVDGYHEAMTAHDVGTPTRWFYTTGKDINDYFASKDHGANRDPFPDDLTCLLFPLDGLDIGRLALFRLVMQDRWFDDVIDNMGSSIPEEG